MSAKLSISAKRRKRTKSTSNMRARAKVKNPVPLLSYLFALLAWACSLLILNTGRSLKYANLAPGQRAPVTILAEVDFRTVDHSATELRRDTTAQAVLPVFSVNEDAMKLGLQTVDKLFDRLAAVYKASPEGAPNAQSIKDLNDDIELLDLQLAAQDLVDAVPRENVDAVRAAIRQSVEAIWSQGIIATAERSSSLGARAKSGKINLLTGPPESAKLKPVEIDTLKLPVEATAAILVAVSSRLSDELPIRQIVAPLISGWVKPNLEYEDERSAELQMAARKDVPLVYRQVRSDTPLMEAGTVVTEEVLELLKVHQARLSETEQSIDVFLDVIGHCILLLGMLIIAGVITQIVCPQILLDPSKVVLAGVLCLGSIGAAKALLYSSSALEWVAPSLVIYWVPYALAAMLATMLVGSKYAMPVIFYSSFGVALALGEDITVFLLGLLSGFTASLSVREIHKRSNVLRAGFFVGIVQLVFCLLLGVIHQTPLQTLTEQSLVAFFTGPLIAVLSLLLIPFFEYLFKITTDVRLLELSDMGHPLLQRLAIEAPGTYHHSLMVANLASAAANEMGANDLLVRVCAYYHDIGKMVKPEFFIENISYKDNPHDDLSPSMSTLVIISHVKEGVSMAARHNLPKPIIDGIEQHHGTSKIAYFYHRAIEQQKEERAADKEKEKSKSKSKKASKIREEDFRYPGPKPQHVEMGILLLADAVEAASRSMEKPSPSNIENLVTEIIAEKLRDGQLDESGMNFTQLAIVKKSFIYNLNNMLHGRVAYPKDKDKEKDKDKDEHRDQQSADPIPAKSTEGGAPRLVAHAAGTKPGA